MNTSRRGKTTESAIVVTPGTSPRPRWLAGGQVVVEGRGRGGRGSAYNSLPCCLPPNPALPHTLASLTPSGPLTGSPRQPLSHTRFFCLARTPSNPPPLHTALPSPLHLPLLIVSDPDPPTRSISPTVTMSIRGLTSIIEQEGSEKTAGRKSVQRRKRQKTNQGGKRRRLTAAVRGTRRWMR